MRHLPYVNRQPWARKRSPFHILASLCIVSSTAITLHRRVSVCLTVISVVLFIGSSRALVLLDVAIYLPSVLVALKARATAYDMFALK